ncbi:MAG: hypothetical protein FWE72_01945 [Spirochaetaceae bacterium]|nr:hypothetical protein [Spirochaetaceae bacterium]
MSELHKNEPLTFDKVWAALMEDREQMRETREQLKETDRIVKEVSKQISKLSNSFGELAEHLVAPSIVDKFNNLGFNFDEISPRGREYADPKTRKYLAEVNIVLENRDILIAVEVKSKLRKQDVDEHVERMEILRHIADARNDKRKYHGAIATAIITGETRNYAHKSGFYVIEQSGDIMKLDIPKGFVPRDW